MVTLLMNRMSTLNIISKLEEKRLYKNNDQKAVHLVIGVH